MFTGYFDGGSKGNLGVIGAYLLDNRGTLVWQVSKVIGCKTNIEAEYEALIALLHEIRQRGLRQVRIYGDSEVVVNQVNESHKVYRLSSYRLCAEAQKIKKERDITLTWIPDEKNIRAHNLCVKAYKSISFGFTFTQLTPNIYLAIENKEQYAVDLTHHACTCSDYIDCGTCQHLEAALETISNKAIA